MATRRLRSATARIHEINTWSSAAVEIDLGECQDHGVDALRRVGEGCSPELETALGPNGLSTDRCQRDLVAARLAGGGQDPCGTDEHLIGTDHIEGLQTWISHDDDAALFHAPTLTVGCLGVNDTIPTDSAMT